MRHLNQRWQRMERVIGSLTNMLTGLQPGALELDSMLWRLRSQRVIIIIMASKFITA